MRFNSDHSDLSDDSFDLSTLSFDVNLAPLAPWILRRNLAHSAFNFVIDRSICARETSGAGLGFADGVAGRVGAEAGSRDVVQHTSTSKRASAANLARLMQRILSVGPSPAIALGGR